jgi:hypothetical protein
MAFALEEDCKSSILLEASLYIVIELKVRGKKPDTYILLGCRPPGNDMPRLRREGGCTIAASLHSFQALSDSIRSMPSRKSAMMSRELKQKHASIERGNDVSVAV